jgi:hypothetical protein
MSFTSDNTNSTNNKKKHNLSTELQKSDTRDSDRNKNKPDVLTVTSTVADYTNKNSSDHACVVYKFQSRPPYEGFVLILVIVIIVVLLLWWLNSKLYVTDIIVAN